MIILVSNTGEELVLAGNGSYIGNVDSRTTITSREYEIILQYILKKICVAEEVNEVPDLTNEQWQTKYGTGCKVMGYKDEKIIVEVKHL